MNLRPAHRIGMIACVALALTGCGRKGALELPPDQPAPGSFTEKLHQANILARPDSPALIQPPTKVVQTPVQEKLDRATANPNPSINRGDTPPKKPFALDPLL